jgi:RNA polymerase sigma factor (sigma-70 family)
LNDSLLVEGLREQKPAAVQHLTECYLPSVWRFVYARVGRDPHLAEDIVSETVLALIRAAADPEADISNPGGWLRSVASNKVNDHFRAAARVQHLIDQVKQTAEVADFDEPSGNQEQEERRAEIREVMDGLPEQQRLALEWKYIDKLSVRSIADRMDVSEKAAESILFRARRDFRDRVTKIDKEDSPPTGTNPGGPANDGDSQPRPQQKAANATAPASREW